jgi:hypothetical protein
MNFRNIPPIEFSTPGKSLSLQNNLNNLIHSYISTIFNLISLLQIFTKANIRITAMKKIYILLLVIILSHIFLKNIYSQNTGWTTPVNISNTPYHSTSPAIAVNKENELFVIWTEYDQPSNDLLARIYFTTYKNSQWSTRIPITTELGKADWTPDIAVDTSGNPHIVWGEWLSGDVFYKYFDGNEWSDKINVSETQGGAFYPSIAINDNTVHIAWHEHGVYYRYLKANQWSDIIRLSDSTMSAGSVKICTGPNNSVHFTWASYGPNNYEWRIWYRKFADNVFSEPEVVYFDTTLHSSGKPVIAVFNNNLPAIVWEQITQAGPLPVIQKIFYSEFNGNEWSEAEAVSDSSRSYRPDISVDNNNIPFVVWDFKGDVLFSYKSNNNWTISENLSYQLSYNSGAAKIVIDHYNNLHVVWYYVQPSPYPKGEIYYSFHDKISSIIDNEDLLTMNDLTIFQNYPNPFNPITTIEFNIAQQGKVLIEVFDVLGQKIEVLLNETLERGKHKIIFNASGLSSGIYFYTINNGRSSITKKMVYLR